MDEYDALIILDTASLEVLGPARDWVRRFSGLLVGIDHHAKNPEFSKIFNFYVCKEDYTSTCEVLCEFIEKTGFKPPPDVAELLLIGIIYIL